jgi:hypothetical protein
MEPRPTRPAPVALVGAGFAAALLLLIGVGTLRDTGGSADLAVFGALLVCLAALVAASVLERVAETRFPAGLPAPRTTTLGGEPATYLPHRSRGAWIVLGFWTVLGLAFGAWGLLDLQGPEPGLAWVFLPLAVFLLGLPVFAATGRWRPGGLWLTPTRMVHHHLSRRTELTWDEVRRPASGGSQLSIEADPSRTRQMTPWARERGFGNEVTFSTATLAVPGPQLAAALRRWAEQPGTREELGTPLAVERLAGAGPVVG